MELVKEKISISDLKKMSEKMFGNIVKAVVDIEKEIMVVDAQLHVDEEELLLEEGSEQKYLWGINIHPSNTPDRWIEFDSMINIPPLDGNRTRSLMILKLEKK